jgi:hypothetical protein
MNKETLPQFGTKEFYTFFSDLCDKNLGGKPKQYSKYLSCCKSEEECYCKEEFKQETLEEATERYWAKQPYNEDAFIEGAKWQMERSYSETEVLQLLLRLQQTEFYNNLYDWFEQNKKK